MSRLPGSPFFFKDASLERERELPGKKFLSVVARSQRRNQANQPELHFLPSSLRKLRIKLAPTDEAASPNPQTGFSPPPPPQDSKCPTFSHRTEQFHSCLSKTFLTMKTFGKPSIVDSLPAPGQKKAAPPLPSPSSLSLPLSPPFFPRNKSRASMQGKKEEKKSLSSPLFWTAPGTEGEGGDESPSPPSATFGCHRHRTTSKGERGPPPLLPVTSHASAGDRLAL